MFKQLMMAFQNATLGESLHLVWWWLGIEHILKRFDLLLARETWWHFHRGGCCFLYVPCWSFAHVVFAVCAFPYILAFTTDSIEIRLVVNGNLVYTAVVPELQLAASRVSIIEGQRSITYMFLSTMDTTILWTLFLFYIHNYVRQR